MPYSFYNLDSLVLHMDTCYSLILARIFSAAYNREKTVKDRY